MLIQFTQPDGEVIMRARAVQRANSGAVTIFDINHKATHVTLAAGVEAEHIWAQAKSRWAAEECPPNNEYAWERLCAAVEWVAR